ncbi:MAG: hypothetical protein ACE5H1_06715 [Thermodesulfobacteriota bacterium]
MRKYLVISIVILFCFVGYGIADEESLETVEEPVLEFNITADPNKNSEIGNDPTVNKFDDLIQANAEDQIALNKENINGIRNPVSVYNGTPNGRAYNNGNYYSGRPYIRSNFYRSPFFRLRYFPGCY